MQFDRHLPALALAGTLLATGLPGARAAELALDVGPLASAQGKLMIAVYASEADFRKSPVRALSEPARPGRILVRVPDLPAGDYAVMVFHDRDGNGRLDTNLLGIPREPWGGSLNGRSVLGAPAWADVRFALPAEGTRMRIEVSP